MPTPERLAEQFEKYRSHVRAVTYRMLGSVSEAEDAVQETWIRLSRTDASGIDNLRGWLTTVVARVCLDLLRTRASRREDPLDVHVPDPIIRAVGIGEEGPESSAVLADSVGLALLVVLEKLEPAERLAFVLHDVFGMSFEEIAPVVDRSVVATRQLASRARRRVQGQAPTSDTDLSEAAPRRRRVSRGRPERRLRSAGRCPGSGHRATSRWWSGEGHVAAGARGSGGRGPSRDVLEARAVQSGGPGEWQHWCRGPPSGRARAVRDRLHDCGRQGR